MFDPSAVFYMNKIAAGPDVADFIDITSPIAANIQRIAKVRKASVSDITVCILDRPRHEKLMAEVRGAGADPADLRRRCGRSDFGLPSRLGDRPAGGYRRHPEGIITAAAIRCMGGEIQATWPQGRRRTPEGNRPRHDLSRVLTTEDLVSGENVFFCATGVTDGDLLKGVRFFGGGCTTQSIVMRSKSGTVRMIDAYHRLSKLNEYSAVDFTGDSSAISLP